MRVFGEVIVLIYDRGEPSTALCRGVHRRKPRAHLHAEEAGTAERLRYLFDLPEVVGAIWKSGPEYEETVYSALAQTSKPAVRIMHCEPDPVSPSLSLNKEEAGRRAAQYLMSHGYTSLAIAGRGADWEEPYIRSFTKHVEAQGKVAHHTAVGKPDVKPNALGGNTRWRMARIMEWLEQIPRPIGLVTTEPGTAAFTVEACQVAGVHVPGEVGVMAIGENTGWLATHSPGVTGLRLGMSAMGTRATEWLYAMINGQEVPRHEPVSAVEVVERSSTQRERWEDPVIAAALDYLHQTQPAHLDLSDLYEAVPASRRTLDRHFKKAFGCTPRSELTRMRINAVAHLLQRTSMPLAEIAAETGYEYISNMCRSFKEVYGMTPSEYREHHVG